MPVNDHCIDAGFGISLRPFSVRITNLGIDRGAGNLYNLVLSAEVIDVRTGQTIEISSRTTQCVGGLDQMPAFARRQLRALLDHELDECLLFEGKQVRDPHENFDPV